jgi:type I restriction enzyme R subunit
MDINGSLATLRHGFKCYGRTLFVAYFKAAHELNPELEERYAKNRLGLTRQLRFSTRSEKSLDVTLSVNGIPIATLELKNAMTGQTVEDARRSTNRTVTRARRSSSSRSARWCISPWTPTRCS